MVVPVTVLGELAAIGRACAVDARLSRVRALRALRLGSTVRLTWEWPAGVGEVRVVWRTADKPTGPTDPNASSADVTRVTYDSRGFTASVGPGEHWFGVCVVGTGGPAAGFGPLVTIRESTRREAYYRVRRRPLRARRRWSLVVEVGDDEQLPPLVLLAKSGVRSMHRDDGEPVLRLPGGPAPMRGDFVLPPTLRRPVYLRAFSLDDELVLVPKRPDDLVVN